MQKRWVEAQEQTVARELALELKDVDFSYGKGEKAVAALKGFSLSAEFGKLTGVLGPNGSGKSTSFKILSTQMLPQSGEAFVAGLSVKEQPHQARLKLGVTFQSPSLDKVMSVEENLAIHAALLGLSASESRSRIDENLKLLGLESKRNAKVSELSGGLARRVELAKTLLGDPEVLLLDEPTTGLDPAAREEFWALLRKFVNEAGEKRRAVVVTTHLMEEAERCDDLVFVSEGKVAAQAPRETLKGDFSDSVFTLGASDLVGLEKKLKDFASGASLDCRVQHSNGRLRLETKSPEKFWGELGNWVGQGLDTVEWNQGTLADIYFQKTGQELVNS